MSGARWAATLVLGSFFIGDGLAAQPSSELHRTVDRILQYTTIDGLTGYAAESFMNHLREVAPDLAADEEARLEGPVQKAFAATRLRDGITDYVAREATDELAALVLNWQERGAPARVREISDSFDPPLTIWEFNWEMNERRGLPERSRLVQAWVAARGDADYHIAHDEAHREAAHLVLAALRDDTPEFRALSADEYERKHARRSNVDWMLWRYVLQGVPDSLVAQVTAEYERRPGQWYTEVYRRAIAATIRRAAEDVVEELRRDRAGRR